jgi:hypothetical protein
LTSDRLSDSYRFLLKHVEWSLVRRFPNVGFTAPAEPRLPGLNCGTPVCRCPPRNRFTTLSLANGLARPRLGSFLALGGASSSFVGDAHSGWKHPRLVRAFEPHLRPIGNSPTRLRSGERVAVALLSCRQTEFGRSPMKRHCPCGPSANGVLSSQPEFNLGLPLSHHCDRLGVNSMAFLPQLGA